MSKLTQDITALAARVRLLEADVETLERGGVDASARGYLLPASQTDIEEARSIARPTTDFRAGEKVDSVSERKEDESEPSMGPYIEWECKSLAGTASLYGITAYRPTGNTQADLDPNAPWQYRKWGGRTLAGSYNQTTHFDNICAGDCFSYVQFDYSGTARFDGGTGDSFEQRYDGCTPVATLTGTPSELSFLTGVRSYDEETCPRPSGWFANASYTLTTADAYICAGQECVEPGFPASAFTQATDATEELVDEATFYAALEALLAEDGDVTEGESCCTELSAAGLTTPEATGPISLTGTAVEIPITLFNGEPDTPYAITVTLSQDNPQPEDPEEPPVPPTVWEVVLEYGDLPLTYYPPLPIPDDFPICVTDVRLGI